MFCKNKIKCDPSKHSINVLYICVEIFLLFQLKYIVAPWKSPASEPNTQPTTNHWTNESDIEQVDEEIKSSISTLFYMRAKQKQLELDHK